jgi:pilus assembly protein FimV
MAFGFGFNKQKVLNSAEKFVQQGKLQNAITEYEKVLKHDPKDLTVNNTIGDLYSRLGDSGKAIECFKVVGDAYAAQGFTVKGIAMYKKITKLQPSVDSSLKLAELYTQQGLFNDARAQYLQVAEDFMKGGDLEQAVRLFQKVLEMDPENVPMRVKLAEVYVRLGKKKEAWEIFSAAAEALRARGSLPGAEEILKRMLVLDPGNSYVLLMRGKAALEGDDPKNAILNLEKAADLDSHPEGLRDLLKAYLQVGNVIQAAPIAEKLLAVHNDAEGLFLMAEGSARLGQYREALDIYTRHADRLLTGDSAKLLSTLHAMITHVRDDAGALDMLLILLNKAGESTHVNEITELLAHACVKDGNLSRAADLYQMLATAEPQNQVHLQNYQQVMDLMTTSSSAGISPEEGTMIIEELEATSPVIDQAWPDNVAIAVRSAVTDADLFLSYNLPEKAIVPLLQVLPEAPRDARLNQRLAALHTRFKRFTEAAVCCRTLESVYHDAGYNDEAVRYGELAARYEQSSEAAASNARRANGLPAPDAPLASRAAAAGTAAAPWPVASVAPAAVPEFSVQELSVHAPSDGHDVASDLSSSPSQDSASEWEDSLSVEDAAPVAETSRGAESASHSDSSSPEIAESVEEVRFYLEHFMIEQARSGMEKLESLTTDASILDPLRAALAAAAQPPAEPEEEIAEINADEVIEPADFEIEVEASNVTEDVAEISVSPDLAGYGDTSDTVAELPQQHLAATAHAPEIARAEVPASLPTDLPDSVAADAAGGESGVLDSLVADLEASLGESFPQAGPPAAPAPVVQRAVAPVASKPAAAPALPSWPVAPAPVAPQTSAASPIPAAAVPSAASKTAAVPVAAPKPMAAASSAPAPASSHPVNPASIDLSEMFGELKQELEEEVAAGDDDPETHYNLGVAFREMGLLDEAIAELQKVCNSIERGQPFAQPVQTYTWLAQCFLDKGVPQAAIRWYEKALGIPGLDPEARLAINYELGSACETAMDKPAALRHFTDVYGANIDYRDVAQRIQALKS